MNNKEKIGIVTDVIGNIGWLSTFKIFSKLIGFISTIYLARILSKEGFGIYSYAFAFLSFFQAFTTEGFRIAGVQLIVPIKQKNDSSLLELTSKVLFLRVASGMIAYLTLFLFIVFTSKSDIQQRFLALIFLLLFICAFDSKWILQGLEKMKIIGISDFARQCAFLILILFFIRGKEDLLIVPYMNISSEILIIFIVFLYVWKFISGRSGPLKLANFLPNKQFVIDFLKHSVPIGLSFSIIILINNLGIIILDFFKGHEKVASYTTVYKITSSLNEFRSLIIFVMFPLFIKMWNGNKNFIRDIFRIGFLFNCVIIIPAAISMMYFSRDIVVLLYSAKYSESAFLFSLLLIDTVILWLNIFFPVFLNAAMNERVYFKAHLFILLISTALLFIFIPFFEARGVVYARIISDIFSLLFFSFYIHKKLAVNLKDIFFTPLLSLTLIVTSALIVLFWMQQKVHSILYCLILLSVYYVLLIIFKIVKKHDITAISYIIKRQPYVE